ncbi:M56 family metallopeptidase [Mucilaginibacter sp. OK098]|uniref:M56 family metallopeptidase n=1 Tax=Mucilaginibacter sp. OK098 TaxID=1855297 RepID=UPI00090F62EB|nr:M56 family metallopeptidase [Mucilaginibacter sp. OK098]SHN13935.1 Signal transducer regulating beta-lactamase production, contains metallopeptidase domain [Mucilaginibacter sp. OK098]
MIPYILHVALLISVCLLFYKVLLQRETFYRLNRIVLVFCLALSFGLPFISIPQQWSLRNTEKPVAINIEPAKTTEPTFTKPQTATVQKQEPIKTVATPVVKTVPVPQSLVKTVSSSPAGLEMPFMQKAIKWLFYLYWIGVAAFGLNLLLQLVVLLYQAYTKPVIRDGKFRIIELTGDKAPCSFGNNIFINPEKYDWETYSQILLHEKVHIQQGHSFDILMAELVLVLQWFNPFAWLYRTELENNLEFLTDDAVLGHKEVERESYQMSLLKVSAPHLSLGITTNYNQSLLKKRIVMMNSKKSNLHIMWKYFFLVPLLGVLACALNDPMAYSQATKIKTKNESHQHHYEGDRSVGVWFATIKNDKVHIEFKSDDDDHNWSNSSSFLLSEFPSLPKDQKGDFTLKREAGSVLFNGKFEGNEGYGHYKFTADKSFNDYLSSQGITEVEDDDSFAYFIVNVKKDYVAMLKRNGFKDLSKNNLISMAALKVDEPYIKMWKENGFDDLSPNQLVSGKAMHIDNAYVSEIRKAGYNDLTFNQLISFKAQHITGDYINGLKKAKLKEGKTGEDSLPTANEISSYKAMNIDSSFVRSFAAIGYKNIPYNQLTTLKALNITPEYVKSFKAMGYNNLTVNNLSSLKSLNITPEFIRGYQALGFKDLSVNNLTNLKALGIDAGYIKTFEAVGYKNLSISNLSTLKSLGITPEFIKSYEPFGFGPLSVNNLSTLKSLDITPEYIRGFQSLGYKSLTVNNLSSLKALGITEEYIKSFEAVGYKNIPVNNLSSLKALGITPDFIKGFKDLGFEDVSVNELSSLKATGVTPAYITEMRGKGFNSKELHKYIQLKNAFN